MVKGPDGVIHSFPDDVTDQEIQKALGVPKQNDPKQPRSRTWTDTAVDAIPMAAAAAGGLLGAASGIPTAGLTSGPAAIAGAGMLGAGGEAIKQLINRARGAEAPATPGAAAVDIAESGAANAAMEGAGQAIGAGMKAAAPWLMQKVLRPSYALLEEYKTTAPKMPKLLLDEGVNVTEGGLSKLQGLLRANTAKIDAAVKNAPGVIPKKEVAAELANTAAKVGKQTNPTAGLQAIADTADEFLQHPVYKGDLTVPEAHAMKKATYQKLGNAYGEMKSANVEAEKALARGLKNSVAERTPGLTALNQREAQLMGAGEAVTRRVAADANADPIGLLWAAHDPSVFLAGLMHKQPVLRSMLAQGMWKSAGSVAKVSPDVLRAAVLAIASGAHGEDEK